MQKRGRMVTPREILDMFYSKYSKSMFCSLYPEKIHCSYNGVENKFFIRECPGNLEAVPTLGLLVGPQYQGGFGCNVTDIQRIWLEDAGP